MPLILSDKGAVKAQRIHTLEGCTRTYSEEELKHRANVDYISTAFGRGLCWLAASTGNQN